MYPPPPVSLQTIRPVVYRGNSSGGDFIGSRFLFGVFRPDLLFDPEENAPAYLQLSQAVHENLLATNIKLSSRKGDMVDKILHELLQNGDMAQKYMQKSRKINIDHFVLLDNYVQGRGVSTGSHIRALRMHSKRSKKHMSVKQHKKCGSFDLPQELHKYDVFRPMHEMWKGYMMQLLETVRKNQLAQCLLNADLHGAFILGVSGIMIRETAETFGIITQDGVFRVVPKKISVFIFQVDCWKVTLHGDKLTSRNLGL
ncbi:ribonuclease MRP protein subunit POP4 isoform X2 [Quercus suber]|uniref:ribonuclease MRP protein subunit POP4 isoform X2 n=1 Tax=Quercus suber TaxID=58331 RepID=UPI0032DFB145